MWVVICLVVGVIFLYDERESRVGHGQRIERLTLFAREGVALRCICLGEYVSPNCSSNLDAVIHEAQCVTCIFDTFDSCVERRIKQKECMNRVKLLPAQWILEHHDRSD